MNQPEVMIAKAHERFDAEGNLTDEATREYVRRLLQSLGGVDVADPATLGALRA